ncbi:hypothetical protein EV383_5552 [Pseudonocardia sediminis]|uniref:Septum formation initiator n=1 Tax=Pseudonocardia sediminis TaxID=1397368 RepID=A0A4Q7V4K7_PSEST|nr:hypothetical protein [Pseudonocardia sediminis]RZT88608.1 hypothetical protein EV383_5552 [Pseudonocardia sediminis]
MSRRSARTGVLLALWVAAAAGALLLGLSAVGSISSGLTGGASSPPLSSGEIEARLALAAPAPPSAPPAAPQQGTPGVVPAGPAGTVLVRCVDGVPSVVSVNPAQGYEAGDDDRGRTVKLEGDDIDVSVALRCDGARPAGTVTVEQDD